jgi:hypothetical protein
MTGSQHLENARICRVFDRIEMSFTLPEPADIHEPTATKGIRDFVTETDRIVLSQTTAEITNFGDAPR